MDVAGTLSDGSDGAIKLPLSLFLSYLGVVDIVATFLIRGNGHTHTHTDSRYLFCKIKKIWYIVLSN